MKLVSFLLRGSPAVVAVAVACGIISGAGSAGLLALVSAELSRGDGAPPGPVWPYLALCAVALSSRVVSEVCLIRIGQKVLFDLRLDLCRQILAAPLQFLEKMGAPRLLATLTDDINAITGALSFIPLLCINLAVTVGCLIYLGWLSTGILLLVFGFMVVGVITYQLPMLRAVRSLREAREEQDAMFRHFRALTDGAKELRLHARRRESFLTRVLSRTASAFRRHNVTGLSIYAAAASWGNILFFIFIGLFLFVLPAISNVSTQARIGYTLVLLYMMAPLQVILNTMPALTRAAVALQKVESLGLTLASAGAEAYAVAEAPPAAWRRLEVVNVTHAYAGEDEGGFTLGPVSLSLEPGEVVFLVGGNGSGKTTLAKLITGLYAPDSGEIRLDGEAVTDTNRDRYRQLFSAIFADFYIFQTLLGLEDERLDERAREYLRQLRLDHKVEVEGGELSTTALSQGQRKRLALLTAYLENRPVYVFDEWAADQDPHFREVFYFQLLPEMKARGKTVLVISHDERYYHVGDRVIKLAYGKVVGDDEGERPLQPAVGVGEAADAVRRL